MDWHSLFGIGIAAGAMLHWPAFSSESMADQIQQIAAAGEPSFDDLRVDHVYSGPTRLPDFKGRDRAFADYRTRIREGLEDGPNFAGHYSIISFGCGTGCTIVYVADNRTGKVFDFPRGGEENFMLELTHQVDSRLLKAQWASYDDDECVVEFFEWKGTQPVLLDKKRLGPKEACWSDQ